MNKLKIFEICLHAFSLVLVGISPVKFVVWLDMISTTNFVGLLCFASLSTMISKFSFIFKLTLLFKDFLIIN